MPELPEVETARRGIAPHLEGQRIAKVILRHTRLRWPIPPQLKRHLTGNTIRRVGRRAKYLLLETDTGTVILHLGMSGSLRALPADTPARKHDHVDLVLENGLCLRLNDPRRFGALLWHEGAIADHPLLARLGPEPLDRSTNGAYLFAQAQGRKTAVKPFLMDNRIMVGVGNIYANEALFMAGLSPRRPAAALTREECDRLCKAIKLILRNAIKQGGTTLRDFVRADGNPGYFTLQLKVYGQGGAPCPRCGAAIKQIRQGQRSSFFCPRCQH
ncbi:MAG: bifunctional DNA-formamidopyrimidine glycosylase/DNA-(apurinic or apyrimidinic site) lyase [Pseudomonadota bacterium]